MSAGSGSSGGMDTGDRAQATARQAANSPWVDRAARVGFAVNGVLHLLIAFIALQVAWGGGSGKKADQSGALALLAENPGGKVVLWLGVLGFLGLGLWQIAEAAFGYGGGAETKDKVGTKVKLVAKAVAYLALAWSAFQYTRGSGSSSGKQSRDFTATLLRQTGGRLLVLVIGLVIIGVGAYHVYKGVTKKFREDLVGNPGEVVERLGLLGYAAKGVALVVVGGLFVAAGAHQKASGATGLDGALKTLRNQPFGTALLTVVAIGLAAFGLYSIARAKYAKL